MHFLLGDVTISAQLPTLPIGAIQQSAPSSHAVRRSGPGGSERAQDFSALLESRSSASLGGRRQVQATHTHLSGEQAQEALSRAWSNVMGEPPSKATLAILTAQWSHETGRGEHMYNFNFGGIKGTGPSGLTVAQRTREGWGATREVIVDNFRAYQSAEEGATDYVSLLARRYGDAVAAAKEGDPSGFVHGLKTGGYFTGNEQLYARSITQLAERALDEGAGLLGSGGPLPEQELLVRPVLSGRGGSGGLPLGAVADLSGLLTSGADAELAGVVDTVRAEAIADEMSRTALRIAASALTRREDDA